MKNQYSRMENNCPKEPRKLRIPDQLDLYMEDGTIYHVRSFFAGDLLMGDVLDALTMEKLERVQLHGGGAGKSPGRDGVLERCDGENHPPQRGVSRPYGTEQDGHGLLQKPQAGQQAGERVDQGGEHP